MTIRRVAVMAAAVGMASAVACATPIETYLALGDSIAWGVTDVTPVSFGDQGYVSKYADFLATINGGVRPNIVNLAIPGETSAGCFTAASPPELPPHDFLASVNLNYQANLTMSQDTAMLNTLAAEAAAGRKITTVTFAIGSNDLKDFEAQHPDFLMLPPDQQQLLLAQYAASLANMYVGTLSQIRAALPNARVMLLTYYNPAGSFPPDDVNNIANSIFVQVHTSVITSVAVPFGATVVDIDTPFRGHETDLTFIASGGIHPNDAGYTVIAEQLAGATIPEPPSLLLAALSLGTVAARKTLTGLGRESRRRIEADVGSN